MRALWPGCWQVEQRCCGLACCILLGAGYHLWSSCTSTNLWPTSRNSSSRCLTINLSIVNLSIAICAEWINNWMKVVGVSTLVDKSSGRYCCLLGYVCCLFAQVFFYNYNSPLTLRNHNSCPATQHILATTSPTPCTYLALISHSHRLFLLSSFLIHYIHTYHGSSFFSDWKSPSCMFTVCTWAAYV